MPLSSANLNNKTSVSPNKTLIWRISAHQIIELPQFLTEKSLVSSLVTSPVVCTVSALLSHQHHKQLTHLITIYPMLNCWSDNHAYERAHLWLSITLCYYNPAVRRSSVSRVYYVLLCQSVLRIALPECIMYCSARVYYVLLCQSVLRIALPECNMYCSARVHYVLLCQSVLCIALPECIMYCSARVHYVLLCQSVLRIALPECIMYCSARVHYVLLCNSKFI